MAEPLKNNFGKNIPQSIAKMISGSHPAFPEREFIEEVLLDYDSLELMPRAWQIADALKKYLPHSYEQAAAILIASLGEKLERTEKMGMAPFVYLPYVFFVAKYGLDHFELSMQAQYELTQRFTAEFSIRPYLEKYPEATINQLSIWATDKNVHVRRLVSEGTRPRLPWAFRLKEFQKNPRPVLELLELLKDDPELYVRRSVANNLNDIGKDNPQILIGTARNWLINASDERRWVIRHALRSAVKRGEQSAFELLGFGQVANIVLDQIKIIPTKVAIGGKIEIRFFINNTSKKTQAILVDLKVHFIKSNGKPSPKVFKLKSIKLKSGEMIEMVKTISVSEMTTRKHYAGMHKVEALINGKAYFIGQFELVNHR